MDVGSVDNFIAEQENEATLQKTQRDLKLLKTFLGTRNELRKIEEIPTLELNEYICEFIISVRTKQRKDYEPSSLRSLVVSYQKTHSFAALTRSFPDTTQLVNKNRARVFSMK